MAYTFALPSFTLPRPSQVAANIRAAATQSILLVPAAGKLAHDAVVKGTIPGKNTILNNPYTYTFLSRIAYVAVLALTTQRYMMLPLQRAIVTGLKKIGVNDDKHLALANKVMGAMRIALFAFSVYSLGWSITATVFAGMAGAIVANSLDEPVHKLELKISNFAAMASAGTQDFVQRMSAVKKLDPDTAKDPKGQTPSDTLLGTGLPTDPTTSLDKKGDVSSQVEAGGKGEPSSLNNGL